MWDYEKGSLMRQKLLAEFVGTFALVFLAVGAAVFGIANTSVPASGVFGVAAAFGLVLMALVYAIGPISGCHINPAVTMGMLVAAKMSVREAVMYWIAQFAGGIVGGAVLKLMVSGLNVPDQTGGLGSNAYSGVGVGAALIAEVLLTLLFVLVILLATDRLAAPGTAGLAIGGALAAVHLVGIPLTGTSVNPARSLGPALFAGVDPLSEVWLFIVAPLAGGILAALIWTLVRIPEPPAEAAAAPERPTAA